MNVIYLSLLHFLVSYRRTALGPFWLLVSPSLFILLIGILYADISSIDLDVFVPYLSIGLIIWTLINGFITGSADLFVRKKSYILNATQTLDDIVLVSAITNVLVFVHQLPIIIVVFIIFNLEFNWIFLQSLLGMILVIFNGVWSGYVFAVLGARYRDLGEIFQALMRIAFLATPILWSPNQESTAFIMNAFLVYNPFYHFIEIIRAPLLGNSPAFFNWVVVCSISLAGVLICLFVRKKYSHFVAMWL